MATENFCKFIVVCFSIWMVTSEDIVIDNEEALSVSAAEPKTEFEWDPKGYVMFCLCMGRFGNQAAHFLGGMAFAKALDRTLVVPPFITYGGRLAKPIPYKEWFDVEPLKDYHRLITMEDFMEHLAPTYWPPGNRTAFCYRPYPEDRKDCAMKEGNPFGPFWDHYGVDFDDDVFHGLGFDLDYHWKEKYPPSRYPVLAFKGAPAHYPERPQDRDLQRYMKWSEYIISIAETYLAENIKGRPYLGVHLRIGSDWSNACKHADGMKSYMESLHCLENTNLVLTQEMCFPSTDQIIRETREVLRSHGLSVVFIASDIRPPLQEFRRGLGSDVDVYWMNPERPQVDLYILEKADVFIGNCPSSFTAFVKRARVLTNQSTLFWGLVSKYSGGS